MFEVFETIQEKEQVREVVFPATRTALAEMVEAWWNDTRDTTSELQSANNQKKAC